MTFATGAAIQHRTHTPPDTWSCPSFVLILRPVTYRIVTFPDVEIRISLGTC